MLTLKTLHAAREDPRSEWCSWDLAQPDKYALKWYQGRDITSPTKVHLVKAVAFPVAMYGCESWTVKKVEHQRTDGFELCWRRRLSPLDSKKIKLINPKGNQPWISIVKTDTEADVQYFGHLMQRVNSLKKTLMGGKTKGKPMRWDKMRGWDGWIASLTQWTSIWANSGY